MQTSRFSALLCGIALLAAGAPVFAEESDAHGCMSAAGYSWCQRVNRCERIWELAKKEGFPTNRESYDAFCNASASTPKPTVKPEPKPTPAPAPKPRPETKPEPAPGSDRDAHGCIPSAGYAWCQRTNRCEHPWEVAQKEGFPSNQESYNAFCNATEPAHKPRNRPSPGSRSKP